MYIGMALCKIPAIEQHIFRLAWITEGTTEKASQPMMPLKAVHNKKAYIQMNKNVCLNTAEWFK
jgi:hypothetical protein